MSRFGTIELLHKEMMNMGNEQTRHCRIGKVISKVAKHPLPNVLPLISWPFMDGPVTPSPQYMAPAP